MNSQFTGDVPLSKTEQIRIKLEAVLDSASPEMRAATAMEIVLTNIAGSQKIPPRDRARLVKQMLPLIRAEALAGVMTKLLSTLKEVPAPLHPLVFSAMAEAICEQHKEAQDECSAALTEAQRIVWTQMSPEQQSEIRAAGGDVPKGL